MCFLNRATPQGRLNYALCFAASSGSQARVAPWILGFSGLCVLVRLGRPTLDSRFLWIFARSESLTFDYWFKKATKPRLPIIQGQHSKPSENQETKKPRIQRQPPKFRGTPETKIPKCEVSLRSPEKTEKPRRQVPKVNLWGLSGR